jgi:transcriptional regulator with XRE-family HTH domain
MRKLTGATQFSVQKGLFWHGPFWKENSARKTMDYSRIFKIARSTKKFSQKELAKALAVDASYVSKIESGESNPSTKTLELLSEKTEIPLYLLILLGSEKNDLKSVEPSAAHKIGNDLLNILISSQVQSGAKK